MSGSRAVGGGTGGSGTPHLSGKSVSKENLEQPSVKYIDDLKNIDRNPWQNFLDPLMPFLFYLKRVNGLNL